MPAVAGSFYERSPARLEAQVEECFRDLPHTHKRSFIGAMVPHAGLMYSGRVAAAFYADAELPRRFIILCPNHTGAGARAAINDRGAWRTPLGDAVIDCQLACALMAGTRLIEQDEAAHAREHSLEVQLPLLQRQLGATGFTFVPLCLATHDYELCEEIGNAIAGVVEGAGEPVGLLASSDLNHYEDQDTTMRKDQLAIDAVLALDPQRLWDVVNEAGISMCGFIPTTTMLIAARRLGATSARLLMHATSGDVNGDLTQVVGYASISIAG